MDWKKIQEIFYKALEIDKPERLAFVKRECADNVKLFNEVISLLNSDDNIHPVLSKKVSEIINFDIKLNFAGQKIGNYKLLQEIASGGMGMVFLAERCDGLFNQKVALKIIKPGLSTIPIIRRFQHERQILANLHHSNIARLYDGGVTEDNRPYFTMEYVDGISIDEYCDINKLTIKKRLNLFLKVCDAVQYAHNNLVIHRDLKPSNILIQKNGGIKLLDFGISKVLSAESDGKDLPTVTMAELNLMTPEYSSPEQIKNGNISVSTDVYSLGLILYKLLSGIPAQKFSNRTFGEFEKVVCEHTISKPSTIVVKRTGEVSAKSILEISKKRKTQPGKLKKILRGDLDNICLKALRKEPDRRYASVEMFAYDIERYLQKLPIRARKESFFYTSSKFLARHKRAVAVAAALFIIVNGLIFFYTIQLKAEKDKAQIEAQKSKQAAAFLQELFRVSDPDESKGETITARELLDKGAAKLRAGLADEPEIKSQLLNTIGKVYTNLGLFKSAEDIFLQIKMNAGIQGIDKVTLAETLLNLGSLYRIKGEYKLAENILQNALLEIKNNFDEENPLLGDCYLNLGGLNYETGKFKLSHSYYENARKIFIKHYGNQSKQVAAVLHDMGMLLFDEGNLDKVDSLYREALGIEIKLNGEINADVAAYQNDLGQVLRHKGQFEEAEKLYEKALNTRIKLFGNNHPDVANTLNHISRLYYNQGMFNKAEPFARKSLKIRLTVFDETHPEVSASRSSLAGVLFAKKKYKEAEKLYRTAYKASLKKLGEKHPYTPALLGNLGRCLTELKKYKEAEIDLSKSLTMLKNIFPDDNVYILGRINWLSDLYNRTEKFTESARLLREELNAIKNKPAENHWMAAVAGSQLGYSLFKQNKNLEAEGLLVNSFNLLKKKKGKNNSETVKALMRIIEFYKAKGRKDLVEQYSSIL